ncbi:pyruvate formate-lyase-activating protein [Bacillus carboniphilus]|uniref:Pyruvate formate-lyase-activating enzyme n=1 Tax=Bacillus carboniphilus TaxID=86663 RepID=A0ABY9JW03_9BACI|nr:pyruvate formate-lyase-activating protein [Bacillus carboniphilus]WLR42453.1 pyruvate formate-lyase-activating protein [Bacillus carboniphilus]
MKTRIHSIETCGTVDGPGLRYIVFTQGCLLRCQYCHNPDTWNVRGGRDITVSEIINDLKEYLPFLKASGGGITVSGGEPLLHVPFLIELFKECKKLGVHTTIDSSGGCFHNHPAFIQPLEELLKYTDLVLLDLKLIDEKRHKKLTGMTNRHILDFAQYLSDKDIPVWIRHVLVPGVTDREDDLAWLADFIKTLNNVKKVEVLPYHQLGMYKWEALGLKYELSHVDPPNDEQVKHAYDVLMGKKVLV